jgi:hypothetical protein
MSVGVAVIIAVILVVVTIGLTSLAFAKPAR